MRFQIKATNGPEDKAFTIDAVNERDAISKVKELGYQAYKVKGPKVKKSIPLDKIAWSLSIITIALIGGWIGFEMFTLASKEVSEQLSEEKEQTAPERADGLTGPQRNALRSAKQYLSISGFSRSGLIQQLSSDAGDGYRVTDATVAVDSLNVDWNEQAVRSAKQYLSISGFSCKGLIEQLSSNAGDGYTVSQATYGARQTSACK